MQMSRNMLAKNNKIKGEHEAKYVICNLYNFLYQLEVIFTCLLHMKCIKLQTLQSNTVAQTGL